MPLLIKNETINETTTALAPPSNTTHNASVHVELPSRLEMTF
ncbi:MAG: hypothetical protein ACW990_05560 [Promethearchaeota archaeon]